MASGLATSSAVVMRPSPLESSRYGPPTPTKACTCDAPMVKPSASTGTLMPPTVLADRVRRPPFSNANAPLTCTKSAMRSVALFRLAPMVWPVKSSSTGSAPVGSS